MRPRLAPAALVAWALMVQAGVGADVYAQREAEWGSKHQYYASLDEDMTPQAARDLFGHQWRHQHHRLATIMVHEHRLSDLLGPILDHAYELPPSQVQKSLVYMGPNHRCGRPVGRVGWGGAGGAGGRRAPPGRQCRLCSRGGAPRGRAAARGAGARDRAGGRRRIVLQGALPPTSGALARHSSACNIFTMPCPNRWPRLLAAGWCGGDLQLPCMGRRRQRPANPPAPTAPLAAPRTPRPGPRRLRRVVHDLIKGGKSIKVGAIGGSITNGAKASVIGETGASLVPASRVRPTAATPPQTVN